MKSKICKFQKKTFDEEDYLCCKLKGKFPCKLLKELKQKLNGTVETTLNPSPEE